MTTAAPRTTHGEQTRARYPDEEGFVERDGVRVFWESYGAGRADAALPPDVDARPLARLEGADPVLRAALPGHHLRPARERAVRPAAGAGAPTTSRVRAGRPRRDGRVRRRPRACVTLSRGAQRGLLLAAEHPERVTGWSSSAPWFPVEPAGRCAGAFSATRAWRGCERPPLRRVVGQVQPATTGRTAATPTSSSGGPSGCSPSRTRPSRSRTRSRGRTTPTARRSALTLVGERAAPATRRDQTALASASAAPFS